MRIHVIVIIATAATASASIVLAGSLSDDPVTDPSSGLVIASDWQLVRANCIACHSARLITHQRGDEVFWASLIDWMQEEQNLWQFDEDTESKIIAYLAKNYPPRTRQRRPQLRPDLMPNVPTRDSEPEP